MTATIIATKSSTPLSWLIRRITNSPYSHLGIKISEKLMIDANWGGVKVRYLPEKFDKFTVEVPNIESLRKANDWLLNQRGKAYDFPGVISTAIYNSLGWKRKNNLQDADKFTCSELVFRYFEEMGITLLCGVDSANFQPNHVVTSIARKKWQELS